MFWPISPPLLGTRKSNGPCHAIFLASLSALACGKAFAQSEPPPELPPDQASSYCVLGTICLAPAAYKENYFDLAAKNFGSNSISTWQFKIGLKTPLFTVHKESRTGIYLGYRMSAYWDIQADSAPFRDINHNPSLFWLNESTLSSGLLTGYEVGIEHISNGADNTSTGPMGTGTNRSRSVDVAVFAEPKISLLGKKLIYQPKFWIPYGTHENTAIRHEWGLLWNTLTYSDLLEISTKGNPFDKGLASVKFHLGLSKDSPGLKASLTLFSGFGDGLLEYQQRKTWLRLGLTFSLYKN
jgi:phospholipase A1